MFNEGSIVTDLLDYRNDREITCLIAGSVFYRLAAFRQSWIEDKDNFFVETANCILTSLIERTSPVISDQLQDTIIDYYPGEDDEVLFKLEPEAILCFEEAVKALNGADLESDVFYHFLETVYGTIQVEDYSGAVTDEVHQKVINDRRFKEELNFLKELGRKCTEFQNGHGIHIFTPKFAN